MANMASACALVLSNDFKSSFGSPLRSWRRTKAAASTCIIVSIVCVCVCVLVTCGVLVAREYSLGSGYEPTTCTVQDIVYTGRELPCTYCPERNKARDKDSMHQCLSLHFPCVQIIVSYQRASTHYPAVMHSDSLHAASAYNKCSYNICVKDNESNGRAVEQFADTWRQKRGEQFACFYNTEQDSDVIQHKRYSKADVIHSMLWPSVVIVVCCGVFLYLETRRRHLTFCGSKDTERSHQQGGRRMGPHDASLPGNTEGHICASASSLRQDQSPNHAHEARVTIRRDHTVDDDDSSSKGSRESLTINKLPSRVQLVRDKKGWKSYSSLEKLISVREDDSSHFLKVGGTGGSKWAGCTKSKSSDRLMGASQNLIDVRVNPLDVPVHVNPARDCRLSVDMTNDNSNNRYHKHHHNNDNQHHHQQRKDQLIKDRSLKDLRQNSDHVHLSCELGPKDNELRRSLRSDPGDRRLSDTAAYATTIPKGGHPP